MTSRPPIRLEARGRPPDPPLLRDGTRRVKDFPASATLGGGKIWWALVPLLAFVFACAAGRDWPFHVGADFPKAANGSARPVATAASLFVYSPGARTLRLRARFQVAEAGSRPPLQISITHGEGGAETWTADTRPTGGGTLLEASAALRLTRGINEVRFTLGAAGAEPTAFFVESARLTQSIFTGGNGLFCLTLAAVAAGSILAARAIGANGLHGFCAASLLGFLLLTASATALSLGHWLTGGMWAVVLLASSLALGAAAALRLRNHPAPAATPENTLRPLEAGVLLTLVCPVFVLNMLLPIAQWDDLMYHGARAGYWMENASALPFISHNDRLAVFPIGGDVLYACGTIISGSEMPGKFLVGLALPLALFALLALLKNAGVRASVALGAAVVFATTPLVFYGGVGIRPDLWLVLLGVITLHGVLTVRRGDPAMSPAAAACLAAAGAGAAFGVKWTAAPILLLAPFALWPPGWRQHPGRRFLSITGSFFAALALGGAGPALLYNLSASHHPFGPREMRRVHQPDPGLHPLTVQLERLPFVLFAVPWVPHEAMRQTIERWETAAADEVGATELLWKETQPTWPGRFRPQVKTVDDGFALGWVFVLLGVAGGLAAFRRRADRETRAAFLLAAGLSFVFVAVVVTQTRWQVYAGLPERFLLPALAFGLVAAAWPADRLLAGRRRRPAAVGLSLLAGLHAVPFVTLAGVPFQRGAATGWQVPAAAATRSEFDAVSRRLLPGRTILLVADQSARDYPLFLAREGFANRVLPWGKAAYEPGAFDRALHRPGVDTVILVSADAIDMSWDPALDARPFVRDLDARGDFARLPGTGPLVVYGRKP